MTLWSQENTLIVYLKKTQNKKTTYLQYLVDNFSNEPTELNDSDDYCTHVKFQEQIQ